MNSDASVLLDKIVLARIDRMKEDFVLNLRIVSTHQEIDKLANLLRSVNVKLGSTSQQVHRAYQTRQSEDVIAMIVADEDVPDIHHREPHLLHLSLDAFATINHEELSSHI